MSQQEKHRMLVLDDGHLIAFTLDPVLRSAGLDVPPFPQPAPQENQ